MVRKAETWSPNELDGEACACSHLVHVLLLAAASPKSKLLPLEEGVVAVIIAFAPALPIIGTYNESGALSRGELRRAPNKESEALSREGRAQAIPRTLPSPSAHLESQQHLGSFSHTSLAFPEHSGCTGTVIGHARLGDRPVSRGGS